MLIKYIFKTADGLVAKETKRIKRSEFNMYDYIKPRHYRAVLKTSLNNMIEDDAVVPDYPSAIPRQYDLIDYKIDKKDNVTVYYKELV